MTGTKVCLKACVFHFGSYTAESGNMAASRKVALATFWKWRLEGEFETSKKAIDGSVFITKVTCKICPQYKLNIPRDPRMRGVEKADVSAFVDGTQQVRKNRKNFTITIKCFLSHLAFKLFKNC